MQFPGKICRFCGNPFTGITHNQVVCPKCKYAEQQRRKSAGHGGSRPGAGRPQGAKNKPHLKIHLSPDEMKQLEQLAGRGTSPELYVTRIIKEIIRNSITY